MANVDEEKIRKWLLLKAKKEAKNKTDTGKDCLGSDLNDSNSDEEECVSVYS